MALSTYGDLKTSIAASIARQDLTTLIPDWVLLCHKEAVRDLRGTLRAQKRDPLFALTGEYVNAPVDFLEVVSIRPNVNNADALSFMPNDSLNTVATVAGTPLWFSVVAGDNSEAFRFSPVPSASMTATLEYYTKLPFFQTDGDTNWILDDHPMIYWFGSMYFAYIYLQNDAAASKMKALYDEAVAKCISTGSRARWGGNSMSVRPE